MDPGVSLFASRDASGQHLVLIALNLSPDSTVDADVALEGCGTLVSRRSFSYGQFSKAIEARGEVAGAGLRERLAPYSINVFDLTLAAPR